MTARLLHMTADDYHADKIGSRPTLSSSIARILLNESPAHARAAHPRLNPELERDQAKHFDIGTAAHALLLEGRDDRVVVVDADDWRTKAAQQARDDAYANGLTPLLAGQWERVREMVDAVRTQLEGFNADPPLLQDGRPESTLAWVENGVHCRALVDWLRDDYRAADDFKTAASANPEQWARSMFRDGCDVQAAFYRRGLRALTGRDVPFRFVVIEKTPPYAVSVLEPGPDVLAVADAKVGYALRVWADCLERDVWPAYPTRVATVELPPWEEARWLEREAREMAA